MQFRTDVTNEGAGRRRKPALRREGGILTFSLRQSEDDRSQTSRRKTPPHAPTPCGNPVQRIKGRGVPSIGKIPHATAQARSRPAAVAMQAT
jgi:hypothetical protein